MREFRSPKAVVARWLGMEPDVFEAAVEKLLVHGGARRDGEGNLSRGGSGWRHPMSSKASTSCGNRRCWILPTRRPVAAWCGWCGISATGTTISRAGVCDVCAPQAAVARQMRRLNAAESRLVAASAGNSGWREGQTVRQLHERLTAGQPDRRTFERLLEALAGTGLIEMREDAFSRDGKVIRLPAAVFD
jgi:DNA topoisomerase-3